MLVGRLTIPESINPPRYVRDMGSIIAQCEPVLRVHLARMRHDTDTRRILCFRPSNNGRFVAELAWDQKKYAFDITPQMEVRLHNCGTTVLRAIQIYAPDLSIEGAELFTIPEETQDTEREIVNNDNQNIVGNGKNEAVHAEIHNNPAPPRAHPAPAPLVVPNTVWNVRTLAAYHAAVEWLFSYSDPSEYLLENDHGKIRALTEKVTLYFSAQAGSVHRALDPLRQYGVLEKEMADGVFTGWWIVRFVENAPSMDEDLKRIWDSRKGKQGRPLLPVSDSGKNGSAPPLLASVSPQAPQNVPSPATPAATQPSPAIPTEFDAKIIMLRELQESLRADAREKLAAVCRDIEKYCNKQEEEIAQMNEQFAAFLSADESCRLVQLHTLLRQLLQEAVQKL